MEQQHDGMISIRSRVNNPYHLYFPMQQFIIQQTVLVTSKQVKGVHSFMTSAKRGKGGKLEMLVNFLDDCEWIFFGERGVFREQRRGRGLLQWTPTCIISKSLSFHNMLKISYIFFFLTFKFCTAFLRRFQFIVPWYRHRK